MTADKKSSKPSHAENMAGVIYVSLNAYRKKFHKKMTAQEVLVALEEVRHAITEAIIEHSESD